MLHRSYLLATGLLLTGAGAAVGQTPELPTPEEYTERAERAEAAPLFSAHTPIRMTLRTDIDWLRDERSDSTEVEGTLSYVDLDGTVTESFVNTRTRGNFRRQKKNCNFPPLRLNFRTSEMEGTVFEGQDKLKLVTPCDHGRDDHQRYIFNEYLAYRVLNEITPASFRVRLIEITYEDINGEYDTRTKIGFLIEDEAEMAARQRGVIMDVTQFHPMRTWGEYSVLAAMFNYMIANTDWSPRLLPQCEARAHGRGATPDRPVRLRLVRDRQRPVRERRSSAPKPDSAGDAATVSWLLSPGIAVAGCRRAIRRGSRRRARALHGLRRPWVRAVRAGRCRGQDRLSRGLLESRR